MLPGELAQDPEGDKSDAHLCHPSVIPWWDHACLPGLQEHWSQPVWESVVFYDYLTLNIQSKLQQIGIH